MCNNGRVTFLIYPGDFQVFCLFEPCDRLKAAHSDPIPTPPNNPVEENVLYHSFNCGSEQVVLETHFSTLLFIWTGWPRFFLHGILMRFEDFQSFCVAFVSPRDPGHDFT